jgi:hypothetical protein
MEEIKEIFRNYRINKDKNLVVSELLKIKTYHKDSRFHWLCSAAQDFELANEGSDEELDSWNDLVSNLKEFFPEIYTKYMQ